MLFLILIFVTAGFSMYKQYKTKEPYMKLRQNRSNLNTQNSMQKIMGYQQKYLCQLQYRLSPSEWLSRAGVASTHSAALRSVLSTSIRHPLSGDFSI